MRFLFLWIVLIRKASSQNGYHPFIPFDPVIDQNRIENQFHPSVIHLDDNQTEIIQYSPNEIYMKKIDPLTKKSVIINLSKLPVDFKEENVNSNGAEGQNMESPLKREVPILEWSPILAKGDTPIKRRGHSIVSIDEMLIVFGGCYLDEKCFNDLHIFDIKSNEWREEKAQGNKPKERAGQTATLFGSKMYVFGGGGREGYLNDLFVLDIETVIFLFVCLCYANFKQIYFFIYHKSNQELKSKTEIDHYQILIYRNYSLHGQNYTFQE